MNEAFRKLQLAIGMGIINLFSKDKVQVKLLDGEVLDNILRPEAYGFSHHPLPGSTAYLLFPSGDRSAGIAIVVGDKRYRMELAEGEVAIHDHQGNFCKIGAGGVITVKASTKVYAETPLFETSADAKIGGNLEVVGTTKMTGRATATAGLTSPADIKAATIKDDTQGFGDMGAKVTALINAHNGHTHPNPEGGSVGAASMTV